ncbi:DUF4232 domain-containing protein [Streptomyces sp. ARC12]|uniref:DUF4232 domain-containing protein n=1 Tax=Streptomyces TaxID=1883 RepID=UPI00167B95E9|nr:DUF4232 domain-containing protein [Streptomyces anulatus]WSR78251.1 DUF4232 domain-containing protein [Streptomyces anulatus]WUC86881.1 DUF4232 domain-containing protein [Streptomyces anulatus]GGY28999.1 hypothetical protein GCM10010342_14770 [Streptomyces anulatus]
MFGKRRKAFLVSAALVGGALLMTACQDTEDGAAPSASATDVPAADAAGADASKGADKGAEQGAGQEPDAKDGGSAEGSGADAGDGTKVPVQQACGANDISWSTRSESQAGGYILIMAKAKQGITCILPAALPTVAFGSDGTEAGPAEQSVGDAVTLSGATTAYAGVNPKTTNTDGGKELDSIIVGVGNEDPDPVSLEVGTITVDKPVVTNWHTAPADAVPSA